jgi:gamma-glutamylputrescine oxidase
MLNIQQLSFWERETYFEAIDFLVLGAGIVGCSAALHLKKKYPSAKVLILDQGYLPTGASTKNAGFACFGSVTELIDDLSRIPETEVWDTVQKRWEGLIYLKEIIGIKNMDFQQNGSWDLIDKATESHLYLNKLDYLNEHVYKITKEKCVYSEDHSVATKFGFETISTSFYNRLEGQIDTGKTMLKYHQIMIENGILMLGGIKVKNIENASYGITIQTNIGEIISANIAICVNGFAKKILPELDVEPARAQVLITKPIENLKIKGTFHYQQGYYYFRNIGNRILFGGGRNLDFKTENTSEFETTHIIRNDLKHKLNTIISPKQSVEIDYFWSGIMGVGETKKPIVKKISKNIVIGVRMGGMGVAIGSLIGKETSELF